MCVQTGVCVLQTGKLGHVPRALAFQLARFVDHHKLTVKAVVSESTSGRISAGMVLTVYAPVATAVRLRSQLTASGVDLIAEPKPRALPSRPRA